MKAVNFTTFCETANYKQIKQALNFYNEPFVIEKVPLYFKNWTLINDSTVHKNGKILTNHNIEKDWFTSMVIDDNYEYCFESTEDVYQTDSMRWNYLPPTFSDFISDCLRNGQIDLEFTEITVNKIYNDKR